MGVRDGLVTELPTRSGLGLHAVLLSMRPAGSGPHDGQVLAPLLMGWPLLATERLSKQARALSKALRLQFEFCQISLKGF